MIFYVYIICDSYECHINRLEILDFFPFLI